MSRAKLGAKLVVRTVCIRYLPAYYMASFKTFISSMLKEQVEKKAKFVQGIAEQGLEWTLDNSDAAFEVAVREQLYKSLSDVIEVAETKGSGHLIDWSRVIETLRRDARNFATNSSSSTSFTANLMDRVRCYVYNDFVSPRGGIVLIEELVEALDGINASAVVNGNVAKTLIERGEAVLVENAVK